jgi:hypothetical protein
MTGMRGLGPGSADPQKREPLPAIGITTLTITSSQWPKTLYVFTIILVKLNLLLAGSGPMGDEI